MPRSRAWPDEAMQPPSENYRGIRPVSCTYQGLRGFFTKTASPEPLGGAVVARKENDRSLNPLFLTNASTTTLA